MTTTTAAQQSGAAKSATSKPAISSKNPAAGKAVAKPSASAATTAGKPMTAPSAMLGAATTIDLSAAARARLAELVGGAPRTSGAAGTSALDDMAKDRSKALADKLVSRLKDLGIPLDLKLDSLGQVTTDSPYKKKIDKMFKEDPDLAKEFKDVAGLNAMKAAQKSLEAFEKEKRAAKDDDGRSAAYGRHTARLMMSQEVSGTMTLDDGKLRSWSVELIDKSVGEVTAATASTRAEEVAARRTSRTA